MLTNVRHLDLKNLENVKTVFEHVSLYVGLVIFTAAGAKVKFQSMVPIIYFFDKRSPSRHKQSFFHLAGALMKHFLEEIALLIHLVH